MNKSDHRFARAPKWTGEEINKAIDLISDYMTPIAYAKYSEWAKKNNYPPRSEISFKSLLRRNGLGLSGSLLVVRRGTIASQLGLADRTVDALLKKSGVKAIKTAQGIGYNSASFYQWFVNSGEWRASIHRIAKRDTRTVIDDWAMLLNIDREVLQDEWRKARDSTTKVRPLLSFEWMSIYRFSREFSIPFSTIYSAIKAGRSTANGFVFEVRKIDEKFN